MIDPYPTRHATLTEPQWCERQEPVIYSAPGRWYSGGGMSVARRMRYASDGYLKLPELFDVEELYDVRVAARAMYETPPDDAILEPGSSMVRSIFAVHRQAEFDRLSRHPALLALAREILGEDVYIHQSRINYKAGMSSTGWAWHSDFETWHAEDGMPTMRAITAMIPLSANLESNGPLMVVPGSHLRFLACPGSTPSDNYHQHLQDQKVGLVDSESLQQLVGYADGRLDSLPCAVGDAVLFDCNTVHGSNSNITPWPRTNLFFVYNAWSNRLEMPVGLHPRPEHVATRENAVRLENLPGHLYPLGLFPR